MSRDGSRSAPVPAVASGRPSPGRLLPDFSASELTVEDLLTSSVEYTIPPFQRTYSWSREQVGQLAGDFFDSDDAGTENYFLGSIVAVRSASALQSSPQLLIDGQQRLTTLCLLLACLSYLLKTDEQLPVEAADRARGRIAQLLFSDDFERLDEEPRPRLRLQRDDAVEFNRILADFGVIDEPHMRDSELAAAARVLRADVMRLSASARRWATAAHPLLAMMEFVRKRVELVRIVVPSERDAFRLFEALNDRGLALSAADLIKNKLFQQAGRDIDSAIEQWRDILTACEDEIVAFLRSYWIATQAFCRKTELYESYRDHVGNLTQNEARTFTLKLSEAAPLYRALTLPSGEGTSIDAERTSVLLRLNGYGAKSCRPALLSVLVHHPGNKALHLQIAQLCEAITVRYSIIGRKNPNLLERLYANMARVLRESTSTAASVLELPELADIPGDDEFRDAFSAASMGRDTASWFHILGALNELESDGDGEARLGSRTNVHIEHILPQNPSPEALVECGLTASTATDALINAVGNLTLLSGRRNRRASNRPFSQKRELYARSDVYMTRLLATQETWSAAAISSRSDRLADLAVRRFRIG
jgi:Protein of unknown function DUF262/Protein of unknown function (DUF1524)